MVRVKSPIFALFVPPVATTLKILSASSLLSVNRAGARVTHCTKGAVGFNEVIKKKRGL